MDIDKYIKILISILIIFLPFIYTGTLWGFPQTPNWGTELMLVFYCSQIICGLIGLCLIYKNYERKK